jgi:hypothetical protein
MGASYEDKNKNFFDPDFYFFIISLLVILNIKVL